MSRSIQRYCQRECSLEQPGLTRFTAACSLALQLVGLCIDAIWYNGGDVVAADIPEYDAATCDLLAAGRVAGIPVLGTLPRRAALAERQPSTPHELALCIARAYAERPDALCVALAWECWRLAWLKAHHPAELLATLLDNAPDEATARALLDEAYACGLVVELHDQPGFAGGLRDRSYTARDGGILGVG